MPLPFVWTSPSCGPLKATVAPESGLPSFVTVPDTVYGVVTVNVTLAVVSAASGSLEATWMTAV